MTDPIADMLTRIRNAIAAKHSRADIPASKLKLEIARILKEEGYINNFVLKGEGLKRTIRIFLRYDARGNGLSDWNVDDISFDAFLRDAVIGPAVKTEHRHFQRRGDVDGEGGSQVIRLSLQPSIPRDPGGDHRVVGAI